jgi:hypothetical protein
LINDTSSLKEITMCSRLVRRSIFMLLWLALTQILFAQTVDKDLPQKVKDEVLATSEGRLRANVAHDAKQISSYLAEEFIHVEPREAIGKEEYMKRYWFSGELLPTAQTLTEPFVFGDREVVFVTGILTDKGSFRGHSGEARFRYTQAYRKVGDRWQCIFDQSSHF